MNLPKPDKVTFEPDAKGKIRWQIKAANGRVIDASSQGFASMRNAERNLARVGRAIARLLQVPE